MIISSSTNAASISGVSISGSTMDMMTYVQALLLQDSDSQLKDLAKEMNGTLELKKSYRKDTTTIELALNKVRGPEKKDQKYAYIGGKRVLTKDIQYSGKAGEKKVTSPNKDILMKELGLDGFQNSKSESGYSTSQYTFDTDGNNGNGSVVNSGPDMDIVKYDDKKKLWYVDEQMLSSASKQLDGAMSDLNTNSEQLNLKLQDLAGKRKGALDTLTSLISKVQDTASGIIRNIGK